LSEQIQKLRTYLKKTGAEFGEPLGLKKSAISMIEKGERGLDYHQLRKIVEEWDVDPRYLFDLIKEPADAIMSNEGSISDYQDLVLEVREMRQQLGETSKDDPVAHRVSINQTLREHVQMIQFLDANVLRQINTMVYGYLQGQRDATGGGNSYGRASGSNGGEDLGKHETA
jgi:transcriptional regulator with XRE-family HTH domain